MKEKKMIKILKFIPNDDYPSLIQNIKDDDFA